MDMGKTGSGEGREMLHPVRGGFGEGHEGAPVGVGHRRIEPAEVAHVELVHHDVLGRLEHGLGEIIPPVREQQRVVEINDLAAAAVGRQAQGVRVGDEVVLDSAG
jgi:hypothetical protein